ncbi:MAG: hypothetical protein LCH61_18775 [Proteobacteria bacterium]|nr:hypothetical protein [Pseudomonadota bacterium]
MGELVGALFNGGGQKKAQEEAAQAREQNRMAQLRQEEQLRAQQAETDAQVKATGRAPRGSRLLVAAGEASGVADKLGG